MITEITMKRIIRHLSLFSIIIIAIFLLSACNSPQDSCEHDFREVWRDEYCESKGSVYFECSKCGSSKTEEIDAAGHDTEMIDAVEPTCTTKGSTAGEICKRCGEYVVLPEEIAPTHKPEIIPAKEATCTENGFTEGQYCSACNKVIVVQQTVYADHVFEVVPAREPTCIEDGWFEYEACKVCNTALIEPQIIPAGHQVEFVGAQAPTCTASGHTEGFKCTRCDYVESGVEVIPAQHKYIVVNGKEGTPASCTQAGLTPERICTECHTVSEQTVIPMLDHTPKLLKGFSASCSADGLTDGYECMSCGHTLTPQTVIPKFAHSVITLAGYAPTCTSAGFTDGEGCENCGAILIPQHPIPASGHNFGSSSTCSSCGISVSSFISYEEQRTDQGDIQYIVSGLDDSFDSSLLVIPKTYNSYPVVGIKEGAFEGKYRLIKIVIPDSIGSVGSGAFYGCTNLETIECGDLAQVSAWEEAWHVGINAGVKITAACNNGKTAYEIYLDVISEISSNYNRYTLSSTYRSFSGADEIQTVSSLVQRAGKDYLAWYSETNHRIDSTPITTVTGFVGGYFYFTADGYLSALSVSYEYWLNMATIISPAIGIQPNDFKNVTLYKDIDGTMHLSLELDPIRLREIIGEIYPTVDLNGAHLSGSMLNYVLNSDGSLKSYCFSTIVNESITIESESKLSYGTDIDRTFIEGARYDNLYANCGDHHSVITVNRVEPTCFAQGNSEFSYCNECGLAITSVEILAPEHKYENGECITCGKAK